MEFVAGLIGAVVALVGSYWVNKFSYKQLFAQTISSNRMDWINVWRENVSKFLACAEIIHDHEVQKNKISKKRVTCKKGKCIVVVFYPTSNETDNKIIEYRKEMLEARAMIISRLNLNEQDHIDMMAALDLFDCNCSEEQFNLQRELVLELTRQILKPEWERLKREAKGKNV